MGSNIDPEVNLRAAIEQLRALFGVVQISSVYRTAPRERTDQPDFLNAVVRGVIEDSPEELLRHLQEIEDALKKEAPFRFGPRTIDLDLLLFGNLVLPSLEEWQNSYNLQPTPRARASEPRATYNLFVPHVRMHKRRFVLEPLCELIDPQKKHPVLEQSWDTLVQKTLDQRCDRVEMTL